MLPTALDPIVDRLISRPARRTLQAAGLTFRLKVDRAFRLLPPDGSRTP